MGNYVPFDLASLTEQAGLEIADRIASNITLGRAKDGYSTQRQPGLSE